MKLTKEQREAMRAELAAKREASFLWFLCRKCEELHLWRGGVIRCYSADEAPEAVVKAKAGA